MSKDIMNRFGYNLRRFGRTVIQAALVLSLLLGSFPAAVVHAANSVPKVLNYQARLTDSGGVQVPDGALSIIFKLYDGDGNCLYTARGTCGTPTAKSVTVTGSVFTTHIGEAADNEIPDGLFDNNVVTLGITIGADAEMTPRKRLTAAAYALNADRLDDLDVTSSGSTTAYIPSTTANGNLVITGDPQGPTVGTGSVYINPSNAAASETLFGIADNGSTRFQIDKEGDIAHTGSLLATAASSTAQFAFRGAASQSTNIFEVQDSGTNRLLSVSATATTSGNQVFVPLGTAETPTIAFNDNTAGFYSPGSSQLAFALNGIQRAGWTTAGLAFISGRIFMPVSSDTAPAYANTTDITTGLYFPTSTSVGLSTAGGRRFITSATSTLINPGHVATYVAGIGTGLPSADLTIADLAVTATDNIFEIQNTSGGGGYTKRYLTVSGTSTRVFGDLMIGEGSGSQMLSLYDINTNNYVRWYSPTANNFQFDLEGTSGYGNFTFNQFKLGIGNTAPANLFTVGSGTSTFEVDESGNILKINNVIYSWPSSQGAASTVLQNNGSGTLSWASASGLVNLNQAYLSSTSTDTYAEISITPSLGAVTIADTFSGTGNIFEIQDRTNATGDYSRRYFSVSSTSTQVVGGSHLIVGATNTMIVNSSGNFEMINGVTTRFPAAQGSSGQLLTNDGAGNLTWTTVSAASTNLNQAYLSSTSTGEFAEISITPSLGALTIADTLSGTGNIFEVQDRTTAAGDYSRRYFTVSATSVNLTQGPAAGGTPTGFKFNGGAHTALTASTEAIDVDYNLARNVQFSAGALTTQRAFYIRAPTYSFTSASTISLAETLVISGPPIAGTNATLTTRYALRVESGDTLVSGNMFSSGFFAGNYGFSSSSGFYNTSTSRFNITIGTLAAGGAYPMRLRSGDGLTAFGGLVTLEADGAYSVTVSATATTIGAYSAGYGTGIGTLTPSASLTVAGNGPTPTSNIFEVQNRSAYNGSYSYRFFSVSSTSTQVTGGSRLIIGATNTMIVNSSGNFEMINGVTSRFPAAQGSSGQLLTNDGAGNLTWTTVSAGSTNLNQAYLSSTSTGEFAEISITPSLGALTIADTLSGTGNVFEIQNRTTAAGSYSQRYFTVSATTVAIGPGLNTASNPSFSFIDDPDTGFYQNIGGAIAFTNDGSTSMVIDPTGAVTIFNSGTLTVNGGTIDIGASTGSLADTPSTLTFANAATSLTIGATTGTTTIRTSLVVSRRLDMPAHAANVGLNIPTNAGAPAGVTGTAEGDLVWDSTGNGLYIYNGSAFASIGAVTNLNQAYMASTGSAEISLTPSVGAVTIADTLSGTGNIFEVQNRTTSAGDYSQRYLTVSATAVGVHTNAPEASFHVNHLIGDSGTAFEVSTLASPLFTVDFQGNIVGQRSLTLSRSAELATDADEFWPVPALNVHPGATFVQDLLQLNLGPTSKLAVTSAGYMGLNDSTPDSLLTVRGPASPTEILFEISNASNSERYMAVSSTGTTVTNLTITGTCTGCGGTTTNLNQAYLSSTSTGEFAEISITPSLGALTIADTLSDTGNVFEIQNRTTAAGSYSQRYFTVSATTVAIGPGLNTATNPSFSFVDDPDTGFYQNVGGAIAFANDGSTSMVIEPTGNVVIFNSGTLTVNGGTIDIGASSGSLADTPTTLTFANAATSLTIGASGA
ncbi:MAG: hypothetical protein WC866_05110, partial [Patescibacteria group bacterium]